MSMSLAAIFFFVVGLGFLSGGAEMLVRGAARLAVALGISPLIVGITVVAYCTSAPELAVGVSSAFAGQTDLAVGNVIGSNIFNILFVLGISSLLVPLVVAGQLIRLHVPVMLAAVILLYLMAADGILSRFEGGILFAGMVGYTAYLVYSSRQEKSAVRAEYDEALRQKPRDKLFDHARSVTLLLAGLGALVLGAGWLVQSATEIARGFGVSELIIGLTIIAVGTSLPEVATSVAASVRRERDIAVGNAIGSNISNVLLVLAVTAIVAPSGVPVPASTLAFDFPVLVGISVACLPIFFTGRLIARWEGGIFLGFYFLFLLYLILTATQPYLLPLFQSALLFFILPLTLITILGTTVRELRVKRPVGRGSENES